MSNPGKSYDAIDSTVNNLANTLSANSPDFQLNDALFTGQSSTFISANANDTQYGYDLTDVDITSTQASVLNSYTGYTTEGQTQHNRQGCKRIAFVGEASSTTPDEHIEGQNMSNDANFSIDLHNQYVAQSSINVKDISKLQEEQQQYIGDQQLTSLQDVDLMQHFMTAINQTNIDNLINQTDIDCYGKDDNFSHCNELHCNELSEAALPPSDNVQNVNYEPATSSDEKRKQTRSSSHDYRVSSSKNLYDILPDKTEADVCYQQSNNQMQYPIYEEQQHNYSTKPVYDNPNTAALAEASVTQSVGGPAENVENNLQQQHESHQKQETDLPTNARKIRVRNGWQLIPHFDPITEELLYYDTDFDKKNNRHNKRWARKQSTTYRELVYVVKDDKIANRQFITSTQERNSPSSLKKPKKHCSKTVKRKDAKPLQSDNVVHVASVPNSDHLQNLNTKLQASQEQTPVTCKQHVEYASVSDGNLPFAYNRYEPLQNQERFKLPVKETINHNVQQHINTVKREEVHPDEKCGYANAKKDKHQSGKDRKTIVTRRAKSENASRRMRQKNTLPAQNQIFYPFPNDAVTSESLQRDYLGGQNLTVNNLPYVAQVFRKAKRTYSGEIVTRTNDQDQFRASSRPIEGYHDATTMAATAEVAETGFLEKKSSVVNSRMLQQNIMRERNPRRPGMRSRSVYPVTAREIVTRTGNQDQFRVSSRLVESYHDATAMAKVAETGYLKEESAVVNNRIQPEKRTRSRNRPDMMTQSVDPVTAGSSFSIPITDNMQASNINYPVVQRRPINCYVNSGSMPDNLRNDTVSTYPQEQYLNVSPPDYGIRSNNLQNDNVSAYPQHQYLNVPPPECGSRSNNIRNDTLTAYPQSQYLNEIQQPEYGSRHYSLRNDPGSAYGQGQYSNVVPSEYGIRNGIEFPYYQNDQVGPELYKR